MKKLKWVVEISVDPSWVADGFDLDDERVHGMVAEILPFALADEFDAKVIKRPGQKIINGLQNNDIKTE